MAETPKNVARSSRKKMANGVVGQRIPLSVFGVQRVVELLEPGQWNTTTTTTTTTTP